MSEYVRGRKQFILGLLVATLVAPIAAGLAALAATMGVLAAREGWRRMMPPERGRGAVAAEPATPRLATQRPVMRAGNRGPGRRSTVRRHHHRVFH
ncbi:hypothetical protein JK358_31225 [Nocardia sp. 2]|uniref:Uncharacterized protein n=1 Tax=Nocardia acididurans TaxID=2802282 RepID=A0ABS1MFP3_9NOCA|nr:hypothetical protein [Nocardia acididurans]MBL1078885.1 hypothetical protein [Nocardia acididurans]